MTVVARGLGARGVAARFVDARAALDHAAVGVCLRFHLHLRVVARERVAHQTLAWLGALGALREAAAGVLGRRLLVLVAIDVDALQRAGGLLALGAAHDAAVFVLDAGPLFASRTVFHVRRACTVERLALDWVATLLRDVSGNNTDAGFAHVILGTAWALGVWIDRVDGVRLRAVLTRRHAQFAHGLLALLADARVGRTHVAVVAVFAKDREQLFVGPARRKAEWAEQVGAARWHATVRVAERAGVGGWWKGD